MSALAEIHRVLTHVQRRWLIFGLLRALAFFFSGGALTLLLLAALCTVGPRSISTLRTVGAGLGIAAVVGLLAQVFVVLRRVGNRRLAARLVQRRFPELSSDLLSTVELTEAQTRGEYRGSPALLSALTQNTSDLITRFRASNALPLHRLRLPGVLLLLASLTWLVAALSAWPRVQGGTLRLLSLVPLPAERISETPLVGDLQLRLDYPAYLGWASRTIIGATGTVVAPRGTQVSFRVTPLRAMRSVTLVLQNGQRRRRRIMRRHHSGQLQTREALVIDGSYHFEGVTLSGAIQRGPREHRVRIQPDTPPQARLLTPPPDEAVPDDQVLAITYDATDDHGLQTLDLVFRLGEGKPTTISLFKSDPRRNQRNVGGEYIWELRQLALSPGSRLSYWLEARDKDTVSGPKVGRSEVAQLRIFDPESRHQQTLARQAQAVEHALQLLADRLLLFAGPKRLSGHDTLNAVRAIHKRQARLLDMLRALQTQMQADPLMPQAMVDQVRDSTRGLQLVTREESHLLAPMRRRRGKALPPSTRRRFSRLNQKQVGTLELQTLLLADLIEEQKLSSAAELGQKLKQTRAELARLLKRYRKKPTTRLRVAIERKIAELQSTYQRLVQKLAQLRRSVPDEYLNTEILQKAALQSKLADLRELFRQGKLKRLSTALAALDGQLSQLQGELGQNLGNYRQQRMGQREQAFARALDQLRDLEDAQRRIAKQTRDAVKRYRGKAATRLRDRVAPRLRHEKERVEKLQRKLDKIRAAGLHAFQQELLERVSGRAAGLQRTLEQADLDQALEMSRLAADGLYSLSEELADAREGISRRTRARVQAQLRRSMEAHKLAESINEDLEAMLPRPGQLFDRKGRTRLARLRKQQQRLRKRTQRLAKQLSASRNNKPSSLGGRRELAQGVSEASDLMQRAGRQLRSIKPSQSLNNQQLAAQRLAQTRQRLRRSRQPRPLPRAAPRQRVNIPRPGQSEGPRAFRQELMEAMREKPEKGYAEAVRRYYEALVR